MLEAAAKWFEAQLRGKPAAPRLDYFKRRGLREETIARFRLGYAPDERNALGALMASRACPRSC